MTTQFHIRCLAKIETIKNLSYIRIEETSNDRYIDLSCHSFIKKEFMENCEVIQKEKFKIICMACYVNHSDCFYLTRLFLFDKMIVFI